MSNEKLAEFALQRIRDILADDTNYQSDSLKLGGIWNWCVVVADYRRFGDTLGSAIEVTMRERVGAPPTVLGDRT